VTKPKDVDFLLGQTPERPSPPFLSFLLNTQQFKRTLIGAKSTTTNQDGPKHARTDPPVKRQESFLSDDIPKYSTDTATTTATATATATANQQILRSNMAKNDIAGVSSDMVRS